MKLSDALDQLVLEHVRSPEYLAYWEPRLSIPRAQLLARQHSLFIRNRRSCWAHLAGNAPLEVKRAIWEHEQDELILDHEAGTDHYTLWILQGAHIGLTRGDFDNAEPLPFALACFLAWERIATQRPWLEAFSASTILERTNDNRLMKGTGHAALSGDRWARDLGLTAEQLPNWTVHKKADDKHSALGQRVLDEYARDEASTEMAVRGARDSLQVYQAWFGGLAFALKQLADEGEP